MVQIFWELVDWVSPFFSINHPSLKTCRIGRILHLESEPGKFSLSYRLGLFLWYAERLIGFAEDLSPTVTHAANGLIQAVTASL